MPATEPTDKTMAPQQIIRLNTTIHSPVRLAILSILISAEHADFNYLKTTTGTTDGNLSTHLNKLQQAGLIRIKKSFRNKKPLTTCSITEKGKKEFSDYLQNLEQIIHHDEKESGPHEEKL
jgi:DNA-binding MarR family transcriptional regulator